MSKQSKTVTDVEKIINEAETRTEEIQKAEKTDAFGDTVATPLHRQRPKGMEVVESGAAYHDFTIEPVYEGSFVSKFLAPKDIPKNNTKKGETIGFTFVNPDSGEMTIISNSHSIQKALEQDGFKSTTKWWIEFQGKIIAAGKPFNRFYIAKQK